MQEYKGFLIDGEARMVHPFYPESYPSGTVYKYGRSSSIVDECLSGPSRASCPAGANCFVPVSNIRTPY